MDKRLDKYRKTVVSQFGEDGIIEHIFTKILPTRQGWCVEFGAYDAKTLSNTWNLIKNKKWNGVLIEANTFKAEQIKRYFSNNDRVHVLNKWVMFSGKNLLDNHLKSTPIPKDFDLLSIDIDGADNHVWDSLKKYTPKLVVIEHNPTIPPHIEYENPKNMSVRHGTSIKSMNKLAKKKGYELVYAYGTNSFFVRKDLFSKFGIKDNSISELYNDDQSLLHLYVLMDGTMKLQGKHPYNWQGIRIEEKHVQVLPKFLRGFDIRWKTIAMLLLRFIGYYKPRVHLSDLTDQKINRLIKNLRGV